ncbi:necrosis inducing protein [Colletotrichum falcatum]|nr:necrosis inducing protein [Colletotrichum falcatum]
MTRRSFLTLFSLGLIAAVSGGTLSRRGDDAFEGKMKDHDAIVPFAQQPADGVAGQIELQFKPVLNDTDGCLPYAAVDAEGYHGGGLKPTGDNSGDCRDPSKGQVYSRLGVSNGRMAVLYAWYLPKMATKTDSTVSRHWYLSTVVWLHTDKCNATAADFAIAGVSYSLGEWGYGSWSSFDNPTLYATDAVSSTHPVVGYDGQSAVYPAGSNVTDGLDVPLISWSKLPQPAVDQFNGFSYAMARCPFQDANFQTSLDNAFRPEFYADLPPEPYAAACAVDPAAAQPSGAVKEARAVQVARALSGAGSGLVLDGPNIDPKHPPSDPVFHDTRKRPANSRTRRPGQPNGAAPVAPLAPGMRGTYYSPKFGRPSRDRTGFRRDLEREEPALDGLQDDLADAPSP